jgi:hypothetical protein
MDTEVTVGGSKARANHKRIRKYREVVAMAFSSNNPLDRELIAEANKAAERRGKSVQDTMRFLCVLTLKNYNKTLDGKSEAQSSGFDLDD